MLSLDADPSSLTLIQSPKISINKIATTNFMFKYTRAPSTTNIVLTDRDNMFEKYCNIIRQYVCCLQTDCLVPGLQGLFF